MKNTLIMVATLIIIGAILLPHLNDWFTYDRSDPELNALIDDCIAKKGRVFVYAADRKVVCTTVTEVQLKVLDNET